jgi:putative zinc finger/helix-turn-helix YgiT family protein
MKSPLTGKEMSEHKEVRTLTFRKESFEIQYYFYRCEDTNEEFESLKQNELNVTQLYNQFRIKHKLPFPEEIKSIREKYGLSVTKMASILGFGANVYRNYESGEVPNESNSRLIELIKDPEEFRKLVLLSETLEGHEQLQLLRRIDELSLENKRFSWQRITESTALGELRPSEYNGYRVPNMEKISQMVAFFAQKVQPYKVKLCKLLFYSDFLHFKKTGFSISGIQYRAIKMGPVPSRFDTLFEEVESRKSVTIRYDYFDENRAAQQYLPGDNTFNVKLFDSSEIEILEKVATSLGGLTTKEISNLSHEETAWKECQDTHSLISYSQYSFDIKGIN